MTSATKFRSALVVALALTAGSVAAHSKKQATVPADGAILTASPDTIMMNFDMPLRVTMQPVSDFSATAPALGAGKYTVEWRGLAADGHPMQGQFSLDIAE